MQNEYAFALEGIQKRIQQAAEKSGRNPKDIQLIWVSKTKAKSAVIGARLLGATHFGENRVQEAEEKFSDKPEGETLHIIGPVQSNKLRKAVLLADWIHTVSDYKKLQKISEYAQEFNKTIHILFQINTSGEETKAGIPLEKAIEWLEHLVPLPNLLYSGLMTIPAHVENAEMNRKEFREMVKLRDQFLGSKDHFTNFNELSMGMSGDLEIAIEEGSTLIRVGTALFGTR